MKHKNSEVYADILSERVRKQKNKKAAAGAVTAVLIAGSVISYAAFPSVRNSVRMTLMKPEKYCASVYRSALDRSDSAVEASAYTQYNASEVNLKLELDESVTDMLRSTLKGDLFTTVSLKADAVSSGGMETSGIEITADDRHVITAEAVKSGERCFVRMPELSDRYISYNLNDGDRELPSAVTSDISPEDMTDIIDRYDEVLLNFILSGDSSIERRTTGECEGVEYRYSRITTEFAPEDVSAFLNALADELENDESLGKSGEELSGMTEDIRKRAGNITEGCTLITYTDPNGDIRGVKLCEKEAEKAGFMMAGKNGLFALRADYDGKYISVTGRDISGKYTGKLKTSEGREFLFEDLAVEENTFLTGKISADISEITNDYIGNSELLFERKGDTQVISTEFPSYGKLEMSMRLYTSDAGEIKIPEDAVDAGNITEYLKEIDRKKAAEAVFNGLGIDINEMMSSFGFSGLLNRAENGIPIPDLNF